MSAYCCVKLDLFINIYYKDFSNGVYVPHQTVRNPVAIKSKLCTIQTFRSSCIL